MFYLTIKLFVFFKNSVRLESGVEIKSSRPNLPQRNTRIRLLPKKTNQVIREESSIAEGDINDESFCQVCNKTFCNKYVCKKHKATKHYDWGSASSTTASFAARGRPSSKKYSTCSESQPALFSVRQRGGAANVGFCNICKKDFYNKGFLRAHEFDKHGIGFMSNPLIDRINKYSRQFYNNKKKILAANSVSCHLCLRFFPTNSLLEMHRSHFHRETPAADESGCSSSQQATNAQQNMAQSIVPLPTIDAGFIHHQQEQVIHVEMCFDCNRQFATRQLCLDHMHQCHPPRPPRPPSIRPYPNNNNNILAGAENTLAKLSFICPNCGYSPIYRPQLLQVHLTTLACIPDLIPIYHTEQDVSKAGYSTQL